MVRLYLLRHAKASRDDPGLDDFDRPLTERGIEDAGAMGNWFKASGILPDAVLCSPAARTRQTLDVMMPRLGETAPIYDDRLYDATGREILTIVSALPSGAATLLLIGHNPGIQDLALLLSGSGDQALIARLAEKFPTGALAVLSARFRHWSRLAAGACRLVTLVRPADLAPSGSVRRALVRP